MKLVVGGAVGAVLIAVLFPAFFQKNVVHKNNQTLHAAEWARKQKMINAALAHFESGDPVKVKAARRTLAQLRVNDPSIPTFAKLLSKRGERAAAYRLMRDKVRFEEKNVPNDQEMEFFAKLAEKAEHQDDAKWARSRIGEPAHFRLWMEGAQDLLDHRRQIHGSFPGAYERSVNTEFDQGLRLYPKFKPEIEAARRNYLN